MGFFSGIRRRIKKLIPKEVRPALPFILAATPLAGLSGPLAGIQSAALRKAIVAGAAKGLSDDEAGIKDVLRTSALAATPDLAVGGLERVAGPTGPYPDTFMGAIRAGAGKAAEGIKGASALKTVGAQSATDFGIKQAELNEKALEEYNANLLSRGIKDKADRRSAIFSIFVNNGYDEDEVNVMLDKYGYADGGKVMAKASMKGYGDFLRKLKKKKRKAKADGGRIGLEKGGMSEERTALFAALLERHPDASTEEIAMMMEEQFPEEFNAGEFSDNLSSGISGLETAFGQPLGGRRPEPMRIIPGFASGGDVDEVMEFDEEIITPEYLMKEEGVPIQEQVSSPNAMDELNSLSLDMFGRPVFELTEEEFEMLKDFASQQALKPGLIDEYRNYKYQMEEQGITPMSPRDYFRNEFGAARLGVAKGGPVEININAGGNNMEDIKGQMAGPDYVVKRMEDLLDLGYDYDTAGAIAMDEDLYREAMDKGPIDDYKKGGKVIKIMPEGVLYKGKAKDYPGIKQLIKDMKKKGTRNKKAEGGLMNLGGNEMDLRGGGFVPMGAKERADDVPARLSKNEFVMTADAVRAAGGGSVQKGADLMYDTMKKLEAQS